MGLANVGRFAGWRGRFETRGAAGAEGPPPGRPVGSGGFGGTVVGRRSRVFPAFLADPARLRAEPGVRSP